MELTPDSLPHNYRLIVPTEVIPEEGDSLEGLVAFVWDLGVEWLPEGFVFDVQYEARPNVWVTASPPNPAFDRDRFVKAATDES